MLLRKRRWRCRIPWETTLGSSRLLKRLGRCSSGVSKVSWEKGSRGTTLLLTSVTSSVFWWEYWWGAGAIMYKGLSKFWGCLFRGDKGDQGHSGGALVPGRERVRFNLFFGTGGGVTSEKNLSSCRKGSEKREREILQLCSLSLVSSSSNCSVPVYCLWAELSINSLWCRVKVGNIVFILPGLSAEKNLQSINFIRFIALLVFCVCGLCIRLYDLLDCCYFFNTLHVGFCRGLLTNTMLLIHTWCLQIPVNHQCLGFSSRRIQIRPILPSLHWLTV